MKLIIGHLYPDLLDLYGDRGNILTLAARCRWRGIDVEIQKVSLGDPLDFDNVDILFLGGGSDREQGLLVEDLKKREEELRDAVENGLVLLTICGGYQLLGQYYLTGEGKKIPGLGILDLYTVAGEKRFIGNVVAEMDHKIQEAVVNNYGAHGDKAFSLEVTTLVGFENHSGKTYLGTGVRPLGKVIRGYGNNGEDGLEGVRYKNVFGTYLHGPFLPKNPYIADLLIGLALKRRGKSADLVWLDDNLEIMAHKAVAKRFAGR